MARGKQRGTVASSSDRNSGKSYSEELARLQLELAHLQAWVKQTRSRIVVIFEGRDAAGKGGMIRRMTERMSPRVFRVVALPSPSDREKSQVFIQRYVTQLPAAGEIVVFDRSWYNRAGVERVMGFSSEEKVQQFLEAVPRFEATLVEAGITLRKYFLDVSEKEQEKRFQQRIDDPMRQWKLSPDGRRIVRRWWDYTRAYDEMFRKTDSKVAPWWVVPSDDKKAARINCLTHFLASIPYERVPFEKPKLGKRQKPPKGAAGEMSYRNVVPHVL